MVVVFSPFPIIFKPGGVARLVGVKVHACLNDVPVVLIQVQVVVVCNSGTVVPLKMGGVLKLQHNITVPNVEICTQTIAADWDHGNTLNVRKPSRNNSDIHDVTFRFALCQAQTLFQKKIMTSFREGEFVKPKAHNLVLTPGNNEVISHIFSAPLIYYGTHQADRS